jgi:hypothetical protein
MSRSFDEVLKAFSHGFLLCGQLRIEVQGESLGVGICHRLACQRRTGSVFAALANFAAPYEVHGTATEHALDDKRLR